MKPTAQSSKDKLLHADELVTYRLKEQGTSYLYDVTPARDYCEEEVYSNAKFIAFLLRFHEEEMPMRKSGRSRLKSVKALRNNPLFVTEYYRIQSAETGKTLAHLHIHVMNGELKEVHLNTKSVSLVLPMAMEFVERYASVHYQNRMTALSHVAQATYRHSLSLSPVTTDNPVLVPLAFTLYPCRSSGNFRIIQVGNGECTGELLKNQDGSAYDVFIHGEFIEKSTDPAEVLLRLQQEFGDRVIPF